MCIQNYRDECREVIRAIRILKIMDDKRYIEIWRNLTYGQISSKPTKEEIEVLKKDFEGIRDVTPEQHRDIIACIGLN